jgi:hypothetical protein
VDAILSLLGRPECRGAVLDGLASDDGRVRRACYRLLAQHDGGLREAVDAALASPDAVLRLYAARDVHRLDDEAVRALLPRLFADRSGAVRVEAAQLAVRLGTEGEPMLRRALLDSYGLARAVAASALAQVGVDVEAVYRDALSGDRTHAVAALEWFAARRNAEDAALVAGFRSDARPRVREAAVEAYVRLARAQAPAVLARMLADASPRVSRAARREAERRRIPIETAALEAPFASDGPAHVRANALRLLARRGAWRSIIPILRGCCDAADAVKSAAAKLLRRWIDSQWVQPAAPAAGDLARFDAALSASADCIADAAVIELLRQVRERAERLGP